MVQHLRCNWNRHTLYRRGVLKIPDLQSGDSNVGLRLFRCDRKNRLVSPTSNFSNCQQASLRAGFCLRSMLGTIVRAEFFRMFWRNWLADLPISYLRFLSANFLNWRSYAQETRNSLYSEISRRPNKIYRINLVSDRNSSTRKTLVPIRELWQL